MKMPPRGYARGGVGLDGLFMLSSEEHFILEQARQGQGEPFGQMEAVQQQRQPERKKLQDILRGRGASKGQERWSLQARLILLASPDCVS